MKLFFLKDDSLYKIFTTLEKIPKQTHIQIFIESENQFFNNVWRSKQIDGILKKRELKATFIAENDQQQKFFEENNINHDIKKISRYRMMMNLLYRFFFNIRKFHLHTYENKNYAFFAIFWSELLLLILLGYFFYSLILPKTTITLSPSFEINEIVYNFRYMYSPDVINYPNDKHIIIPIYTGIANDISITSEIKKDTVVGNKKVIEWSVRMINTTNNPISLQAKTQLIDENGIEFVTKNKVDIPRSQWKEQAWVAYVTIISKDNPENITLLEQFGDKVTVWHRLIIKNLRQSRNTKQVYAEISDGFMTDKPKGNEYILFGEIGELQKQLYDELFDKRKSHIKTSDIPEWWVFVPFNKFISLTGCTYSAQWDNQNEKLLQTFSGSLTCDIQFGYVLKNDIVNWIRTYISNRSNNTRKVINIQDNSINFFELLTGEYNANIMPTRVNIIESYNLEEDTNNVISTIKSKIAGKTLEEWRKILSTYPEIEKGDISISPRWYSSITTLQSRIFIKIKDQSL